MAIRLTTTRNVSGNVSGGNLEIYQVHSFWIKTTGLVNGGVYDATEYQIYNVYNLTDGFSAGQYLVLRQTFASIWSIVWRIKSGGSTWETPHIALPLNQWNHVALVRDGLTTNAKKIYLNGSLIHTADWPFADNASIVKYGANSLSGNVTNIILDEMSMWFSNLIDEKLNENRIQQLALGVSPLQMPIYPKNYWPVINSNTLRNITGSGNLTASPSNLYLDISPSILRPLPTSVDKAKIPTTVYGGLTDNITFAGSLSASVQRHLANAIAFAVEADTNIKIGALESNIVLTDTINRTIEEAIEHFLEFHNDSETNIIIRELEQAIGFDIDLSIQLELTRLIEQWIGLEHKIGPTKTGTLEAIVSLLVDVARGADPTNDVGFNQDISVTQSKPIDNDVSFDGVISAQQETTKALDGSATFDNFLVGFIESTSCNLHEYNPAGDLVSDPTGAARDTILLTFGATTLELRNPEFGDRVEIAPRRVFNRSRNGTVNIAQLSHWSKKRELEFTIRCLTESEKDAIISFYQESLGKEVTYTDPYSRSWTGILIQPDNPVIEEGYCNFVATFRLRA